MCTKYTPHIDWSAVLLKLADSHEMFQRYNIFSDTLFDLWLVPSKKQPVNIEREDILDSLHQHPRFLFLWDLSWQKKTTNVASYHRCNFYHLFVLG